MYKFGNIAIRDVVAATGAQPKVASPSAGVYLFVDNPFEVGKDVANVSWSFRMNAAGGTP